MRYEADIIGVIMSESIKMNHEMKMGKCISMWKRIMAGLLTALSIAFMAACGQEEPSGEFARPVYYISSSETKVEQHFREIVADDPEEQLQELLGCLRTNPAKLEYKAPLAMGFQVLNASREGETLMLDVDANYLTLSATTEVLVRAALVRTLTQLEGVRFVGITVEGSQLYDSVGNQVGWMSADQFIENDGNEINTYELARVQLYFASEDGNSLIVTNREKYYSTSMPRERFVVEELIAGPGSQVEGIYPSVNPNTKVLSVTTRDSICYVNLDESFLTVVNNVPTEISVYSIVNSLVELSTINRVQILVNGEVPTSLSTTAYERNLDIVTVLEK